MSQTESVAVAESATDGKIVCHIDNERVHSIALHIKNKHADTWTVDRYQQEFPDAPLLSKLAEETIAKRAAEKLVEQKIQMAAPAPDAKAPTITANMAVFHELFDLGNAPAALSAAGAPINVSVMTGHGDDDYTYLERVDHNYVYNIDLLKKVMVGFQLNMPIYLWGYHGTGKTTLLQQAAARTKRPFVRVQHTINMQESDVLGQWTVRDGHTQFQLGPLPMAMIRGWTYCADEYDFAMPSVLSVYQPVLEGQPLLIKDAPPHLRRIIPHENFRFTATGNTNGVGDETGLYQGTLVQNAANYSRFAITEEVTYMDAKIEANILTSRTGITSKDADRIVRFANQIRKEFADGRISMTVSPRELINAAKIGIAYGGKWEIGLQLSFSNRLSRTDREVVAQFMQRIFA